MPTQTATQTATQTDDRSIARRRLILRDSLSFLSLLMVTMVLFAITLFLFKSFSIHRDDLAHRWSDRAAKAMQAGKPGDAIVALRTALAYAPGDRQYEMLLAQALGEAGNLDESYNYFMGLWATEPGNGAINLQLARLAAKRSERESAVNFYRASIYGTWEGDGVPRRAAVRVELARYLIALHELPQARMELLIAGGNMPDDPDFDLTLGRLLEQADDAADARTFYQKALARRPKDVAALGAAGQLAFRLGEYESARRLLARAAAAQGDGHGSDFEEQQDLQMMHNAQRIVELTPAAALPARERAQRVIEDRAIARHRLDACSAQLGASSSAALQTITTRWGSPASIAGLAQLTRDPQSQDETMQLVYDTEVVTNSSCGTPTGDDALLLVMARNAAAAPAGAVAGASQR